MRTKRAANHHKFVTSRRAEFGKALACNCCDFKLSYDPRSSICPEPLFYNPSLTWRAPQPTTRRRNVTQSLFTGLNSTVFVSSPSLGFSSFTPSHSIRLTIRQDIFRLQHSLPASQ